MAGPVLMSEGDLVDVIRMHFTLLSEQMAELAARNPDKSIIKLSTETQGYEVDAAIMAKPIPQPPQHKEERDT